METSQIELLKEELASSTLRYAQLESKCNKESSDLLNDIVQMRESLKVINGNTILTLEDEITSLKHKLNELHITLN